MKHVMLDIETLGNKNNSVITSIGACYFDPDTGEIGATLHQHINIESCIKSGLKMDTSTIMWWLGQEKDAQQKLTNGQSEAISLYDALNELAGFISTDAQVWGNGATFDNTIVKNAYDAVGLIPSWKFWNDRDVRTMVELGRKLGFDPKRDMPFTGVRHCALDDAIHQAKYVSAIWQKITGCEMSKSLEWFKIAMPTPTIEQACIQVGCHLEEVAEMLEVLGNAHEAEVIHSLANLYKSSDPACVDNIILVDKTKLLDSTLDQNVTSVGVSWTLSMDHLGGYKEVNRANFSKFEYGHAVFNEQGKIKKGEFYSGPELANFAYPNDNVPK